MVWHPFQRAEMKIAIVVAGFPPRCLAGTEIATYNIARHLAKRDYEVHVITSLDKGLSRESMEEGFYIHRVSSPKVRVLGFILFRLKILFLLKKLNPDMVHAQGVGIGICGFLAKKLFKKNYVVWNRGYAVLYSSRLFDRVSSRLVLKNADAVIALTKDMKKEIQRRICNRHVFVIPNGIDLSEFEGPSLVRTRSELHINPAERIILFVGRLRPEKAVEYLIEAMNVIGQECPMARLLIVGDGKERQNLESLVTKLDLGKGINFVGEVPHEEVPVYMAASDVFVLSSLSEGFPSVLLEAMAAGLPVVATNVKGLSEIIEEGENGFLVEPRDPEGIAEKVLQFLGDDDLRQRISRNNKKKVREYSWEGVIDRIEEVYASLNASQL